MISLGIQECPKNQTDATMTRSVCSLSFQERMSIRPFYRRSPAPTNRATVTHRCCWVSCWVGYLTKMTGKTPAPFCRAAGLRHWVGPENTSCFGSLGPSTVNCFSAPPTLGIKYLPLEAVAYCCHRSPGEDGNGLCSIQSHFDIPLPWSPGWCRVHSISSPTVLQPQGVWPELWTLSQEKCICTDKILQPISGELCGLWCHPLSVVKKLHASFYLILLPG